VKLCTRKMHLVPEEEFYHDSSRRDGLDPWCKECRREWRGRRPRLSLRDLHEGPIILALPPGREWPRTSYFNSETRKYCDAAQREGRTVVVVRYGEDIDGPVWRWREWEEAEWVTLDDFLASQGISKEQP